ncbi:MAG: response regulator [Lachnospiraceae bacterium]|nr:response regulator [Lachnospiraceae bacterium]
MKSGYERVSRFEKAEIRKEEASSEDGKIKDKKSDHKGNKEQGRDDESPPKEGGGRHSGYGSASSVGSLGTDLLEDRSFATHDSDTVEGAYESSVDSYSRIGKKDGTVPEDDAVILDDRIVPDIKPAEYTDKPLVVVIDDDFTVLDIMKIFLARGYTYKGFTNSKDAVFFLNNNVPSLILLDSFMPMISSKRIISIVRSSEYTKDVPIYYICEESEKAAVKKKLSDDVRGIITRPVARGRIQEVLDEVFKKDDYNV